MHQLLPKNRARSFLVVGSGGVPAGRRSEKRHGNASRASPPRRLSGQARTSGFYEWMFNGARVYKVFADTHPLLRTGRYSGEPATFETFPHAITCALLGRDFALANQKRTQRRRLLEELGLDTAQLKSIDFLDAALCAVTAQRLIQGKTRAYGDDAGGYIFVPKLH